MLGAVNIQDMPKTGCHGFESQHFLNKNGLYSTYLLAGLCTVCFLFILTRFKMVAKNYISVVVVSLVVKVKKSLTKMLI